METKSRRTPGPLTSNEIGPVAGDVIISRGERVYRGGTISQTAQQNIKLKYPLDFGEVGTAHNGYFQSNNPLDL